MKALFDEALTFAERAHFGQVRKYTNEPFVLHPIRVSYLARRRGLSMDTIIGAILHDTVEDSNGVITLGDIEHRFGSEIKRIVQYSMKVSTLADGNRAARIALDIDHYSKGPVESQHIKLLDAIDNLSDMIIYDPVFAKKYASEKELLAHALLKVGLVDEAIAQELISLIDDIKKR